MKKNFGKSKPYLGESEIGKKYGYATIIDSWKHDTLGILAHAECICGNKFVNTLYKVRKYREACIQSINRYSDNSYIYVIRNTSNDRYYIGMTNSVIARRHEHLISLINKIHFNKKLQEEFKKNNYEFYLLEKVENMWRHDLEKLEKFYINKYQPYYNIKDVTKNDNPEMIDFSLLEKI